MSQHPRLFVPIMAAGAGLVAAGQSLGSAIQAGSVPVWRLALGAVADLIFMPGLLAYGLGIFAVALALGWLLLQRDPWPLFALLRNPLLLVAVVITILLAVLGETAEGDLAEYAMGGLALGLLLFAGWTQLGLFDPRRVGYLLALLFIGGSVVLPWFAMPSMFLPHTGATGPPTESWQWLLLLPGLGVQIYEFLVHAAPAGVSDFTAADGS